MCLPLKFHISCIDCPYTVCKGLILCACCIIVSKERERERESARDCGGSRESDKDFMLLHFSAESVELIIKLTAY